jgi:hypothetical protein
VTSRWNRYQLNQIDETLLPLMAAMDHSKVVENTAERVEEAAEEEE